MRWIAKAAAQRVISTLPRAVEVNYYFQRNVTRRLPQSDEDFDLHICEALRHFRAFERHVHDADPSTAHFYEFGAGWDLVSSILYYALGVERQTLVDVKPILRLELINDSLRRIETRWHIINDKTRRPLRPLPRKAVYSLDQLDEFGIKYLAPCDARKTTLPEHSIDFISNTFTLEHIPEVDVRSVLIECRRLLRIGGVMSSSIDMQDHYSFFDPTITAYNFLKFRERTWRFVNSPLHHQNRLRLVDYDEIFRDVGLDIVERSTSGPSPSDGDVLRGLELAPRFRNRYSIADLGTREARFIVRKV